MNIVLHTYCNTGSHLRSPKISAAAYQLFSRETQKNRNMFPRIPELLIILTRNIKEQKHVFKGYQKFSIILTGRTNDHKINEKHCQRHNRPKALEYSGHYFKAEASTSFEILVKLQLGVVWPKARTHRITLTNPCNDFNKSMQQL